MASTSEDQAIADLYALLQTVEGVSRVTDYEPSPTDILDEQVTIYPAGRTPTEFQMQVRLYVRKPDLQIAQRRLRELTAAVEAVLMGQTQFGPSACSYQWVDVIGWMALWPLSTIREDYF